MIKALSKSKPMNSIRFHTVFFLWMPDKSRLTSLIFLSSDLPVYQSVSDKLLISISVISRHRQTILAIVLYALELRVLWVFVWKSF